MRLRDRAGAVLDEPVVNGAVAFCHDEQLETPLTVTLLGASSEVVGEHLFGAV